MSAVTFPSSPNTNDVFTAANGSAYLWDGTRWVNTGTLDQPVKRDGTEVSLSHSGDDLNIDSDTLFVDASTNRISIGHTTPLTALDISGDITVSGTVDSRDIATDGTKLDGIEAAADVTDATNVVAALTAGSNITIAADGTIAATSGTPSAAEILTAITSVDGAGSGLDADLLDGLQLHTGRNNEVNKVVRTDASGYIQAGWINSVSGDSGFATRLTRITCSNDNYLRYLGLTDFKVSMGESAKNNYSRRVDYTSDGNYHVGSFGNNGYGANETFHGGSGFWDIWSGTNYPSGLTHIHGFNALHYTTSSLGTTGGNAYGWQMAAQYNSDSGPWWRRCSGGSFSGWLKLVSYGNNTSGSIYAEAFYDHNNTAYYTDPASTSNLNALTVNSTFTVNNGWSYVANNYGYGIVGLYTHTIFQLVFAMGNSYKTTAGGGISNLYGMAWSYPSAGGIAGNLDSHGMIVAINGGFGSCMSYSIVASGNVTAYSDERLKRNWKNLPENFVELLSKVKSGSYDRIDGEQLRQVGASAQSLRPILPEAVIEADDEFKTLSISYGNAALVSAIELAKEIVDLKEQLNSQNTIIQSLINRLELLENK